jgi:hypothetical protein
MVTQSILDRFKEEDIDEAGVTEIEKLKLMDFEAADEPPQDSRLVLVLVESRLLEAIDSDGPSAEELTDRLERFKEDLWLDGFTSRFIEADIYSGGRHQDGRTILALRRLFQTVWDRYNNFEGVVMVGNFPDAHLARRWVWRRHLTKTIDGTEYDRDFLRIVPEGVAGRSDIVLADLNGNWDAIYEEGPKELESIIAIPDESTPSDWPKDDQKITSDTFEVETKTFEDFFWIRDDQYTIHENDGNTLEIQVQLDKRNPELTAADRRLPNPIARPDIHISRINPRHVADAPDPSFRDQNGNGLLDENGNPQPVEVSDGHPHDYFEFDPGLERELLVDYFDRNHAFRDGELAEEVDFRPAAAAHPSHDFPVGPLLRYLDDADPDFGSGISFDHATLLDYVTFLKKSAVLRGVQAHSNPWNTRFGTSYDVDALESAVGDNPWRWTNTEDDRYEPSLTDQDSHADLYLHRSLYHNDALPDNAASFWIHIGCSVNTPGGAGSIPYTDEDYGSFQNAAGILFYAKTLALASRAKVFYDRPRGFPEEFGESLTSRFGEGLAEYYRREAQDQKLDTFDKIASCKRAYNWSVLGDWTLRLRYYSHSEDCLSLDNDRLSIEHHDDHWTIVEGDSHYVTTAPTQDEAEEILDVIDQYDLDQVCYVGGPDPSMTYWLSSGEPPAGYTAQQDLLEYDMHSYDVLEEEHGLTITDGRSRILTCSNYREAAEILRTLREYRFDKHGFVGRPDSSMQYFLTSE